MMDVGLMLAITGLLLLFSGMYVRVTRLEAEVTRLRVRDRQRFYAEHGFEVRYPGDDF